jgi:general secretion pathway protein G
MKCIFSRSQRAFTLVELIVVVAVLGVLAAMAIPVFSSYIDKAKVTSSSADIRTVEKAITAYVIDKNTLPDNLPQAGFTGRDPWGRPYIYSKIDSIPDPRLDFLGLPLNSDYDLYSQGADGTSAAAANDPSSSDDIIRTNDGSFAGSRAGL